MNPWRRGASCYFTFILFADTPILIQNMHYFTMSDFNKDKNHKTSLKMLY